MTEAAVRTAGELPAEGVRAMFDRVARVYDPLNTAMSAGLDGRWRERAADLAWVRPGDRVLDVATGTGELAIELARRVAPHGEVVGCDFSEAMLARARTKAPHVRFEQADALALPYPDDSFAAATCAYALRNFADTERGVAELARVVRTGGNVVVLDFTTPRRLPLSLFYRLWFDRTVPLLGRLAGDPDAYAYLPASVARYPPPEQIAAIFARAGLEHVRYVVTAGGIVTFHVGTTR